MMSKQHSMQLEELQQLAPIPKPKVLQHLASEADQGPTQQFQNSFKGEIDRAGADSENGEYKRLVEKLELAERSDDSYDDSPGRVLEQNRVSGFDKQKAAGTGEEEYFSFEERRGN